MAIDPLWHVARRRVRLIKAFYLHAIAFVPAAIAAASVLLLVPGAAWLRWPLYAWAAAFILHGLLARGFAWYGTGWFSPQWGDAKMCEMYDRLSRKRLRRRSRG
jgi:hypothetical protein